MKQWMKIALFVGLTLLPVSFVLIYQKFFATISGGVSPSGEGYKEVYWQKLRDLDYRTGKMSGDLENLNNQAVAIPGFVVPLDDNDQGLSEFLLVPTPTACIHVPPPPPNQMVMVRMKGGEAPKREWGPVWVKGTLRIETSKSGFGDVSFLLLGEKSEKYQQAQ